MVGLFFGRRLIRKGSSGFWLGRQVNLAIDSRCFWWVAVALRRACTGAPLATYLNPRPLACVRLR